MTPLDEALAFIENSESVNYAQVSRMFKCDETTLRRRHQGKQRSMSDVTYLNKTALSKQQESDLCEYIRVLTKRGILPTLQMVKNFAEEMAKTALGKNWPYTFVKRHQNDLDCSWFDGFDSSRKHADNEGRYRHYFELVRGLFRGVDIILISIDRSKSGLI